MAFIFKTRGHMKTMGHRALLPLLILEIGCLVGYKVELHSIKMHLKTRL